MADIGTMIIELEAKVQKALDAFTTAQLNRDPNLKHFEDELVRLNSELSALKMRRPV